MLAHVKYAVKYLLGRDQAGNNFTVFPDDTFLVSYPKSGNTWVRFLLANLIYPNETVGFANINRLLPAPGVSSKRFLRNLPRPRILKSHEPFDVRAEEGVVQLLGDRPDRRIFGYARIGHQDIELTFLCLDLSVKTIEVSPRRHVTLHAGCVRSNLRDG